MRTTTAPAHPAPPEELYWDAQVALYAESRAPHDAEPCKGFLLRLHADSACIDRLAPDHPLVAKRYEQVRADTVCLACSEHLIATSSSSVVRRLRDAERTLHRMRGSASDVPMSKEVVHCRALRFEAESAVSVHPDAADLAARVADLATQVGYSLREAVAAYDRRR